MAETRKGKNPLTNAERQKRFREKNRATAEINADAEKTENEILQMTGAEFLDHLSASFSQECIDSFIAALPDAPL